MPFIHVRAYPGAPLEGKKKAAEAMVKSTSEILGFPEEVFVVIFEEVEPDAWVETVAKPIIEPNRDKMLIEGGKVL